MEERLQKYREKEKEIARIEEEIALKERDKFRATGSVRNDDIKTNIANYSNIMTKSSYIESGVEKQIVRAIDLPSNIEQEIIKLKSELDVLVAYNNRTITIVKNTLKHQEQEVVIYKYVKGYEVWKIAQVLNRTEDAVNKIHNRALKFLKNASL